jgi:hypothetical protein
LKAGPGQRVEIYPTEGGQVLVVGEDGYETFSDREAYSEWVSSSTRMRWTRGDEEVLWDAAAELGLPCETDIDWSAHGARALTVRLDALSSPPPTQE